jgi:cytochrome c oxidase subunit 2
MLVFVLKYRRVDGREAEKTATHSNSLEAVWSIIPAILVAIIFAWGFWGYMDIRQAPDNSYEIQVYAKKWTWSFEYPNGYIDENLHVPADTPIRLVMSSSDVIHSLYVPSFRLKMDVVPGRYSTTWFNALDPGAEEAEYNLFCAEYCGDQHSTMTAKVVVHPSGEFEKWLEDASNFLDRMTPEEGGQLLYEKRGCIQCHSVDGSAKTGPTFKGTFGTEQSLVSGEKVTIDENYIRESIIDPMAKVRAGYKPVMPPYGAQLKDEEINAIIAYIKSLK